MSTKKNSRAKPAPKPASAKSARTKLGGAKANRPSTKATAGPATLPRASGLEREATSTVSESLLKLTTANFAALRKQLTASGSKRVHGATANDDKNLAETLKRLEASYCDLLRGQ
jgi:hypothetical protein